jgi:hypothetical protein
MRCDPALGPRDENEATKGAGAIFTSWVFCITPDGVLHCTNQD